MCRRCERRLGRCRRRLPVTGQYGCRALVGGSTLVRHDDGSRSFLAGVGARRLRQQSAHVDIRASRMPHRRGGDIERGSGVVDPDMDGEVSREDVLVHRAQRGPGIRCRVLQGARGRSSGGPRRRVTHALTATAPPRIDECVAERSAPRGSRTSRALPLREASTPSR